MTGSKGQGKKERYAYITVLHFKSNITVAMHVLQRLVYISGTNNAHVMIPIVARAWESWLSATFHLMSIACLVAEIFNCHSKISKHCNSYVAHCICHIRNVDMI